MNTILYVFVWIFAFFWGAKYPVCPIFQLRFFPIAALLQHLRDSTCAKVESLNIKSGGVTAGPANEYALPNFWQKQDQPYKGIIMSR
jgi:hypothetical protein